MKTLIFLITLLSSVCYAGSVPDPLAWGIHTGPQSDPNLKLNDVPSALNWNSYFNRKLDYNPFGLPISLGGTGATNKQQALINLGIVNTQSANLLAFSGLTGANNKIPYFTGLGTMNNALVSGDCSNSEMAFTCTKTNGVSFVASATTDTTNAANISTGVLPAARGGTGISNSKTLAVNANLTLSGTDGSTLNVGTGGTLGSGAYATAYSLPIATTSVLGGVKPDNSSVLVNGSGVLSAPGSGGGIVSVGTANALGYFPSATNTISPLTTANNGVLITSSGGVPSISSTLPAATQANITSTGTVTSGTWNGGVIGGTYGGTGVNNGARTLTMASSLTTTGTASQTLAFPALSYTYTFPSVSDIVTMNGFAQTLTNKTLSGSNNTFSNIALSSLVTQNANTIVGNGSGSTASPTALAIGSCSGSNNGLTWTTNAGFGCNTLTTYAGTSSTKAINISNAAEQVAVSGTAPATTQNFYVASGAVQYYTPSNVNNYTLNWAWSAGTALNTAMAINDSVTTVMAITNGASTAYYPTAFTIDGVSITPKWLGGTAPSSGNLSSIDVYTCSIIKTASATYTILCAQSTYK